MAASNGIGFDSSDVKHEWIWSCERWQGTKSQLQALGLGLKSLFPGEPGAPKWKVRAIDHRGLKIQIQKPKAWQRMPDGMFIAECPYVDRSEPDWRDGEEPKQHAPGVMMFRSIYGQDEFRGSSAALVACGLVTLGELPGQPGRNNTFRSVAPDGSACIRGSSRWSLPGSKQLKRIGTDRFTVEVRVGEEEAARREKLRRERHSRVMLENAAGRKKREELYSPSPTTDSEPSQVLKAMAVLHRRKLPAGWRVIAGSSSMGAQHG